MEEHSLSWDSQTMTNILMEADTFQFMQPKHFPALEEEERLIQRDGVRVRGSPEGLGEIDPPLSAARKRSTIQDWLTLRDDMGGVPRFSQGSYFPVV